MIEHITYMGGFPESYLELQGMDHDLSNEDIVVEICAHVTHFFDLYKQWSVDSGYDPDGEDPEMHPDYWSKPENWQVVEDDKVLQLKASVLEAYVKGNTKRFLAIEFEID